MEQGNSIEQLLIEGERVLWRGKPQWHPFILSSFYISFGGMLFLAGPAIILWGILTRPIQNIGRIGPLLFLAPFLFFGVLLFGAPLFSMRVHRYEEYVVTNRRVFLHSGLRGQYLKIVQLEDIRSLTIKTGWINAKYGTATVKLYIGEHGGESHARYDSLSNIARPAEVIKLIQNGIEENRTAA